MARSSAVPVTMGSAQFHTMDTANFRLTEARFPPGAVLEPHTHDRAIFAVMLRGGFRTRIAHKELPCDRGSGFVEPIAEKHANYVGREGATTLVIQPDPANAELLHPFTKLLDEVHLVRHPAVLLQAPKVLDEIRHRDALNALCAEAHVMLLLAGAARLMIRDADGHRPPGWLTRARDILHDEWRSTTCLSRVAGAVGVHPCHLAHVFRAHFGESVGSYVRKLRINWAVGQLALAERPIAHVALDAGFSDQSHFTRECRRHLGTTPAAYRARVARAPFLSA